MGVQGVMWPLAISLDPKIFSKKKMAVSSIYGIERAMNQLWHNHFYHKPARCDCTVVQYAKIGFYFNATRWRPFLWRHKRYFIAIKMAAQLWEIWKITLWPPFTKSWIRPWSGHAFKHFREWEREGAYVTCTRFLEYRCKVIIPLCLSVVPTWSVRGSQFISS